MEHSSSWCESFDSRYNAESTGMFIYRGYLTSLITWHSLSASQISWTHVPPLRNNALFVLSSIEKWAFFNVLLKQFDFRRLWRFGCILISQSFWWTNIRPLLHASVQASSVGKYGRYSPKRKEHTRLVIFGMARYIAGVIPRKVFCQNKKMLMTRDGSNHP